MLALEGRFFLILHCEREKRVGKNKVLLVIVKILNFIDCTRNGLFHIIRFLKKCTASCCKPGTYISKYKLINFFLICGTLPSE